MRVGVLCSHKLGIPALTHLAGSERVAAIGVPERETEDTEAVRQLAEGFRLPLTVLSRRDLLAELERWVGEHRLDVAVAMTFPYRVPEAALDQPVEGFFNFHFGLLPRYRGADAVFWQIRNREPFGGITVHRMDAGFDTGPIADVERVAILPGDSYGAHSDNLSLACPALAERFLFALEAGRIELAAQDEGQAGTWARPGGGDVCIDWEQFGAAEVRALVNATNPWNRGAYTLFRGGPVRILEASPAAAGGAGSAAAGSVVAVDPERGLVVQCADGERLHLDAVLSDETYFTGRQLAGLGVRTGERFLTLTP